jgi:two-component system response regulator BaeR
MTIRPRRLNLAIVESDPDLANTLIGRIEPLGWRAQFIDGQDPLLDIDQLLAELGSHNADAAAIDLLALAVDPWALLDRLCVALPDLGILITTAESTPTDRTRGLRIGADDWIAKPYDIDETAARIEAIARRRLRIRHRLVGPAVQIDRLEIRPEQLQAFYDGRSLDLTPGEFEVLQLLADDAGHVIKREDLYQRLRGTTMPAGDRTIDAFVFKLRAKLDHAARDREFIHTHARVGYRFKP